MCCDWPGIDAIGTGSTSIPSRTAGRSGRRVASVSRIDEAERGGAPHASRTGIREAHDAERTAGRDARWSRRSAGTGTSRSRTWSRVPLPGVRAVAAARSRRAVRLSALDEDDARAERLLRVRLHLPPRPLRDHAGGYGGERRLRARGREWYGYEGLAASGLDAVFENFLDGTATIPSKGGWKWTDVMHDLGMHLADVAHQSTVVIGSTVDDILEAHRTGQDRDGPVHGRRRDDRERARSARRAVRPRRADVRDRVQRVEPAGRRREGSGGWWPHAVRARRSPAHEPPGMAIDLSHTGDETARQTCEASERPVFLSHSGARALFSNGS